MLSQIIEEVENICRKKNYSIMFSFILDKYIIELYYKEKKTAYFNYHGNSLIDVYEHTLSFLNNEIELDKCDDWIKEDKLFDSFKNDNFDFFIDRYKNLLSDEKLIEEIKIQYNKSGIDYTNNMEMILIKILNKIWGLNNIKNIDFSNDFELYNKYTKNQLVVVKPCGKEYNNKSYIGIYLGDFPQTVKANIEEDTLIVSPTLNNPLIYMFETKTVVFGSNSWWKKIENIEEFEKLTDNEIENTWYVQVMKNFMKG